MLYLKFGIQAFFKGFDSEWPRNNHKGPQHVREGLEEAESWSTSLPLLIKAIQLLFPFCIKIDVLVLMQFSWPTKNKQKKGHSNYTFVNLSCGYTCTDAKWSLYKLTHCSSACDNKRFVTTQIFINRRLVSHCIYVQQNTMQLWKGICRPVCIVYYCLLEREVVGDNMYILAYAWRNSRNS